MNPSAPFIDRPVATSLMAAAIFLIGCFAWARLPVSSLPAIDLPVVSIFASRPGANPVTMATTVAAPLERRLATIPGLERLTSQSFFGTTQILAQFDLDRGIDAAARDVQAAINAANKDLPADLPAAPMFRKASSASMPVVTLALTSKDLPLSAIYDAADSVIAQRIGRLHGVGEVRLGGGSQPAIRVQVDPARLASMGIGVDQVANIVRRANVRTPTGVIGGGEQTFSLATTDQLTAPEEFANVVVASKNRSVVRLGEVATIERNVRDRLAAGWFNGRPAILVIISKQANANVVDTVDAVKASLPELQRWIPAGIDIDILSDRTQSIRASIHETAMALTLSVVLVIFVVWFFLRRPAAILAAGVTVPLSILGAFAVMWAFGYSLNNLTLMALTIAVGLVIDDAVVMVENIERHEESGLTPLEAAHAGSRQVAFTIFSLSISLIAVLAPILFMGGVVGRALHEFAVTLAAAIVFSMLLSLTVTPALLAHFPVAPSTRRSRPARATMPLTLALARLYGGTLGFVLRHPRAAALVSLACVALSIQLFMGLPKGNLPQDDVGLIDATTEAGTDVSFSEMARLQTEAMEIIRADKDVQGVGAFIGGPLLNEGNVYIALKPRDERRATSSEVANRLRGRLAGIVGLKTYLSPVQELSSNVRRSKAQFQFTLSSPSLADLEQTAMRLKEALALRPEIVDVTTDHEMGGLRANLVIDRKAAGRTGVSAASIDAALNSAFGQRQDSIIYAPRNQYRVVFEVGEAARRGVGDLSRLYVAGGGGALTPLSSVAHVETGAAPLVINHQSLLPAITLSYNLAPGSRMESAGRVVETTVESIGLPSGMHAEFAGEAADFRKIVGALPLLIIGAVVVVYVNLGILYESLVHPVTILSTLPSAGLGALLALRFTDSEFTVISLIGLLLLIGIVKKNGIILVDFAQHVRRTPGVSAIDAAIDASTERLRPILMTTIAALLGALPLLLASGIGAELRRPLGLTIIGGLLISQMLTLYTTPAIYCLMSKFERPVRPDSAEEREKPKA